MFFKVLKKVNFKVLTKTYIISYYRATPVFKTLRVISYLS